MVIRVLAAFFLLAATTHPADATSQPFVFDTEGTTTTVTVGSDAACNYANITQAVILAPAASNLIVRVAKNNVMTGTQTIIGRDNVGIFGGYDTCSSTTQNGHTVLDGSAFTGSVLRTNASFSGTGTYRVYLSAITIANGTGSSMFPGGGMTIDGPFSVYLTDTFVLSNSTAFSGGGVSIRGELGTGMVDTERTKLVMYGNTNFIGNQATTGGGIACTGRVYIQMSNSLISANTATSVGGGIASQQCFFQSYGHLSSQGIRNNTVSGAGGAGGGIYAAGGTVYLQPFPGSSSVVANNSAETGGGIDAVTGNLYVVDSSVINNTAQLRGGGIYTVNATTVMARVTGASSCHAPLRCSELSGNQVAGTGATASGGGLFASGGTTIVAGTFVENNRVASGRGMAIAVLNATGTNGGLDVNGLRLLGGVVATSGTGGPAVGADSSVVHIENSSAEIGFNTFSRNLAVPRIVYTPTTGGGPLYPIRIYGTIFDSPTGLAASPGTTGTVPAGDCNRLNESSSTFSASSARSTFVAPMFVNSALGDYSLAPTSEMLDWCDASFNFPIILTAEGGVRPYDDPGFPPAFGNWDLGALERQPLDILFKNGFD